MGKPLNGFKQEEGSDVIKIFHFENVTVAAVRQTGPRGPVNAIRR